MLQMSVIDNEGGSNLFLPHVLPMSCIEEVNLSNYQRN